MKKTLLVGILLSNVISIAAQADIYCPPGPADCIKSTDGHITCTVLGNDGNWSYKKGFYPLILPQPNTHYYFPFALAAIGIGKYGVAECGYLTFNNDDMNGPTFVYNTPLIRSTPGLNGWNPSPVGNGYYCQPTPGICPFKNAS